MADRKISDLTALTTPASGDYLPIVDISEAAAASKNKRVTIQSLFQGIPVNVGIGTTDMYGTFNVQRNTTSQYSTISLGDFAAANNSVGIYGRVSSSGIFGISSAGAPIVFYNTGSGTGEAVRITSSGRVGIGTTSPGYALDVQIATSSANTGARIYNSTVGTGNSASLSFSVANAFSSTNQHAAIQAISEVSTNTLTSLAFLTSGGSNAGNATERVRIDSSGRVGIGTGAPNNALSIVGTGSQLANSSIRINSTAGTQSANSGLWITGNQSTSHYNWLIGSQYNVGSAFEITPSTAVDGATFTTPALLVTQTGRVGIGTTSPTTLLDVNADTVRVRTARTPASASATGATGEICWDANYIYVCIATNTWKRSALSTW